MSSDLTWARAIEMHAEALGLDTSLIPLLMYEQPGKLLVRFCRGDEAELACVLEKYVKDPWVAKNRPMVTHLAKHYAKYHLAAHDVSDEDRAERARKRAEAIQDAKITIDMSDDPRAVAAAKARLKELGA